MTTRLWNALICVPVFLVGHGCTVGPDYVPPTADAPTDWNTELPTTLRRDPATLGDWWTTFSDPKLTALVEQAARDNLALRQAALRIREARAQRKAASSSQFPTLSARGLAAQVSSGDALPVEIDDDFYAVGFDAAWEIDVFGRIRRLVEAADANAEATEEEYRDVLVTLVSEVALSYVEVRSFQEQLSTCEARRDTEEESLGLIRAAFEAGQISRLALEQASTSLDLTRSSIPALRTGAEQAKNRLAALLALQPEALDESLDGRTGVPSPPETIAIGIPAETIRRRPDVRRAERALAAQTAMVGVATADLYPRFQLLGSIGLDALDPGGLLSGSSSVFGIGPSMRWSVFDAGRVRSNITIQNVRQEQALLAYEQAVLRALHDVESSIVALAQEQIRRDALERAEASSASAMAIAEDRFEMGESAYLRVLESRLALLSIRDQITRSDARIASYTISLYKALGGGWSTLAPEPRSADARPMSVGGDL